MIGLASSRIDRRRSATAANPARAIAASARTNTRDTLECSEETGAARCGRGTAPLAMTGTRVELTVPTDLWRPNGATTSTTRELLVGPCPARLPRPSELGEPV